MNFYWSAVVFGFLGSFHCIGMCGPIVLALPAQSFFKKLLYNLGRTVTYALMGLGLGLIGEGFSIIGWQQQLSVIVGSLMLIIVVFTKYKHFDLPLTGPMGKVWAKTKVQLGYLMVKESVVSSFLVGLLNGLLPCGLVYAALFAAVAQGNAVESSVYMIFFGLGTIPMLLAVAIFGNWLAPKWRTLFNRLVPYFLALVAILLILRGLNLGIPMVSPKTDESGQMMHKHGDHPMGEDNPEHPKSDSSDHPMN